MKKIIRYFLLCLLCFVPCTMKAIQLDLQKYYMEILPQENGDVLFRELLIIQGNYNGYIRDIAYKDRNTPLFTGKKEHFEASTLYNGSGVVVQKVCNMELPEQLSFDAIHGRVCEEIKVEKSSLSDQTGVSLKMYNASHGGVKGFYLEYIVKDVIVQHNDFEEFYFPLIQSNFEDEIEQMEVRFVLPKKTELLRAWGHGMYYGDIQLDSSNSTVFFTIPKLQPNIPIDIRVAFDQDLLLPSKKSGVSAWDNVLEIEQKRAEEANRFYEEMEKEQTILKRRQTLIKGATIAWYLGLLGLLIFVYIKYDKEQKSSFDHDYLREFPAEYGPEILEYLLKQNLGGEALSASLLEVIRKKAFIIKEHSAKKEDYILKRGTPKEELTESEAFLVDWFLNDVGTKDQVTLKQIKNASSTNKKALKFYQKYEAWKGKVMTRAYHEDFFEHQDHIKIISCLYCFLGFLLFFLHITFDTNMILGYSLFFVSFIAMIYFIAFKKRTIKGNDHYVKWMALKRFLNDFGDFKEKELPEIVLWEKYLVYATVFGIAKKLEKTMRIRLASMDTNTYNTSDLVFISLHRGNFSFTNQINRAVSRGMILPTDTVGTRSSGGGFGGGFSGGGSIGGGFSGGGRGF